MQTQPAPNWPSYALLELRKSPVDFADDGLALLVGDARDRMRGIPDRSVRTAVTSPPYFGLRDYGVQGQIGLEASLDLYVASLVAVAEEVRRVLTDDGTSGSTSATASRVRRARVEAAPTTAATSARWVIPARNQFPMDSRTRT